MSYSLNNKYQLKTYVAKIADINYYNEIHKILRIDFNSKLFDFKYLGNEVPHPTRHIAIITTSEEAIDDIGISSDRQSFLPGIADKVGNLINLPLGFAQIISINQTLSTTNPNSGGAGFSIQKTNMFDLGKVIIAISPPTQKDYTNTDTAMTIAEVDQGIKEDIRNQNVGIFINEDGTILVKSKGSSITLGEEGLYFAGKVGWESTSHDKEWMADNPFSSFIGSSIPTYALAINEWPNIGKFAQFAEGARKFRGIVSKVAKVSILLSEMKV